MQIVVVVKLFFAYLKSQVGCVNYGSHMENYLKVQHSVDN